MPQPAAHSQTFRRPAGSRRFPLVPTQHKPWRLYSHLYGDQRPVVALLATARQCAIYRWQWQSVSSAQAEHKAASDGLCQCRTSYFDHCTTTIEQVKFQENTWAKSNKIPGSLVLVSSL